MYEDLKKEYFLQLKIYNLNNDNKILDDTDIEKIFKYNIDILNDKTNSLNTLLYELLKNNNLIDLNKVKMEINNDLLINLIECYLDRMNINYNDLNEEFSTYNDSFDQLIKEIKDVKYNPLNREEERELLIKYKNGHKEIKNIIIEKNLRLVLSVANRYDGHFLSKNDLFSFGITGLYKALEKYDYTLDYKFSTYATYWIRQAITREIYIRKPNINIPLYVQTLTSKYNKIENELSIELNRIPTEKEIFENGNFTKNQQDVIRKQHFSIVSLDDPVFENEKTKVSDTIVDNNSLYDYENIENKIYINSILEKIHINPKEIEIFNLIHGLNGHPSLKLEQIGKKYGLTKQRVSYINSRIIEKINKYLEQPTVVQNIDSKKEMIEDSIKNYSKKKRNM